MDERKNPPGATDGALFVDAGDDLDLDNDADDDRGEGGRVPRSRGGPGDGKAEQAAEILAGILSRMELDTRVTVREDGERVVLDVIGEDAGRAIGKKGQTLDALQFLVNKIVNRFPTGRRHIIVDSGDYRDRYDHGLVSMARREAKRAVQMGRVITLEPMSARDRRVIHLSLAKFEGVTTRSDGQGLDRRIQIIPSRGSRGEAPIPSRSSDRDRGGRDRGGRGRGGRGGRDRGGERRGPIVDRLPVDRPMGGPTPVADPGPEREGILAADAPRRDDDFDDEL